MTSFDRDTAFAPSTRTGTASWHGWWTLVRDLSTSARDRGIAEGAAVLVGMLDGLGLDA
jgi:hypothetical protein